MWRVEGMGQNGGRLLSARRMPRRRCQRRSNTPAGVPAASRSCSRGVACNHPADRGTLHATCCVEAKKSCRTTRRPLWPQDPPRRQHPPAAAIEISLGMMAGLLEVGSPLARGSTAAPQRRRSERRCIVQ